MRRSRAALSLVFFVMACRSAKPSVTSAALGGREALLVATPAAQATIVPSIGRVMQFSLGASQPGPFWNHPTSGSSLAPDAEGWINHGGDKAWPAPQSDWRRVTGRVWPPPLTFDARPYTATVRGDA